MGIFNLNTELSPEIHDSFADFWGRLDESTLALVDGATQAIVDANQRARVNSLGSKKWVDRLGIATQHKVDDQDMFDNYDPYRGRTSIPEMFRPEYFQHPRFKRYAHVVPEVRAVMGEPIIDSPTALQPATIAGDAVGPLDENVTWRESAAASVASHAQPRDVMQGNLDREAGMAA